MFIDDEELRTIFKSSSEEHLQRLEEGLLHLEKQPNDLNCLEGLLREAHSLKGDANMLGVKEIGTLAHKLEDILGTVKRGETQFSPELSDRVYQGMDAIRKLVHEAVTGEPSGISSFHVLARLMGAITPEDPPASESPTVPAIETALEIQAEVTPPEAAPPVPPPELQAPVYPDPETEAHPLEAHPAESEHSIPIRKNGHQPSEAPHNGSTPASEPAEITSNGSYRIETIRVETQKLDALMNQAGELTVTKIRIAHRLSEIEEVITLWEEWSRDTFVNRFLLSNVGVEHRHHHQRNDPTSLQKFYQRSENRLERLGQLLNRLRNAAYEDNARLEAVSSELEEGIRSLRLLPLSTIFNLMPRMVRDLSRQEKKQVELVIEGGDTRVDKRILEEMKDPLMHMIRNAIDHGIEIPEVRERQGKPATALIRLRGYQTANNIVIEVTDDGRGLDLESIKQTALKRGIIREDETENLTPSQIQSFIFAPGFSTRNFITEVSGRGVGLDVVRTNVEHLKGSIQVDSTPGQGCTLRVQLGTTLATAHVLIVSIDEIAYAVPVEAVKTTLLVQQNEIFAIEGSETILQEGHPISVVRLADLLELPASAKLETREQSSLLPCIVLEQGEHRLGLLVDALLDEQDVVLKPQSKLLKRVRNVSGATILGTGEVCMVLNPQDLIKSVRKRTVSSAVRRAPEITQKKQVVLLVEDSITIRTQEKRILESAGYEVVTAVDGLDGYNKLKTRSFDAVVSDVQMPNLDGLSLAAKIRQHREYSELPIILVTSLASEEDKQRGAEAGASAYITKGTFDQKVLLDTLRRLA